LIDKFLITDEALPPTRKKVAVFFENSYMAKYSINFDEIS
jgi:hypothetical protein